MSAKPPIINILVLVFLTVILPDVNALGDSTEVDTPFRKGRNLVGIGGAISSFTTNWNNNNQKNNYSNNYRFDIRMAKFIADKNMLGLRFQTEREHSQGYTNRESEIVTIGPWYRYYFQLRGDGSVYGETCVYFANTHAELEVLQQGNNYHEVLNGQGVGTLFGIGYTYVIVDRIGFEVGFNVMFTELWGTSDNSQSSTRQDLDFLRFDYTFRFGFVVLFNRFRSQ